MMSCFSQGCEGTVYAAPPIGEGLQSQADTICLRKNRFYFYTIEDGDYVFGTYKVFKDTLRLSEDSSRNDGKYKRPNIFTLKISKDKLSPISKLFSDENRLFTDFEKDYHFFKIRQMKSRSSK